MVIENFTLPYTEFPVGAGSEAFSERKVIYRPVVPIILNNKGRRLSVLGVLDSGADESVFPSIFGRQIGLDVESGKRHPFAGVGSSNIAYFHDIMVEFYVDGRPYNYSGFVGFTAALDEIGLGLLGRNDFFNLFETIQFDQKNKLVLLTADVAYAKAQSLPPQV